MNPSVKSSALEINLKRTAVDVVIPEKHRLLLEIVAPLYGIQQETEKLLIEVNHTYVGWKETLEDLHYRAMGDFFHYNDHERGAEGLEIYCCLYEKAARDASSDLREVAVRYWLYYLEKIARESGDHLSRNTKPLRISFHALEALFDAHPEAALGASPRLRRCAKALSQHGEESEAIEAVLVSGRALLASALDRVYPTWLALEDPIDWFRESVARGAESHASPPSHPRDGDADLVETSLPDPLP
ncbi:MAG: hypothetical protein KAI47_04695 [Deltaproteobacteria bacterium]|nr:hypothetical protein [Deltaproteobacteria bacterium]